jgi:O-Antigen ligase
MLARRLRLGALDRSEVTLAAAAMALTALLALAGIHKLGAAGLLAPLAVVALAILLTRPLLAVCVVVGLTILCEGPTFGLLTFTTHFFVHVYKYLTLLDVLVAVAVVAVAIDVVRTGRRLWVPRPLRPAIVFLGLGMLVGAVVGHAAGAGIRYALGSEDVLFYLLALPLAVANLQLDTRRLTQLLAGAGALAVLKAVLGLIEVAGHHGPAIEGTATLSYYEPAANWLILIAGLAILAALLMRARPPLWLTLSAPLLLACLLLSYRRSFWIAAVLGIVLVVLIGTSPGGRRVLVQGVTALAVTIWLLGSISFQSQLPIVKRVASLSPSKLEANQQDRYRLDERANVLGAIREHPFTGLGITVPWSASVHPLSVEREEGRQYVHFAVLWFWLKLGILGLFAYIAVMVGSMTLAWRAWRAASEPLLRAFALASLAGIAGLVAMDTTASFTGVDPRFTVLFAAQLGLLARLASRPPVDQAASSASTAPV